MNDNMSVKEIKTAIAQLPTNELTELTAWLLNYQEQAWDNQIEEDLESGRLDSLLEAVDKEYEAGLAKLI
jgi:BioD-like phosphotransacetylase family protein